MGEEIVNSDLSEEERELARKQKILDDLTHRVFGEDATPMDIRDLDAQAMTDEERRQALEGIERYFKKQSEDRTKTEQSGS